MSFINPKINHQGLRKNDIGLTLHDYQGAVSTLCAGCGHDSVTSAIQRSFHELSIEPHRAGKMSGIGCSSKTPAYFLSQSHGFNSVHGRMPSVTTGANAANRNLKYIGVSGDGDSLSIGLGQLSHGIRRNLNMLYVLENNGVYGLTKGQFSAAADFGSLNKAGIANTQSAVDPVMLALSLGATFIARSFSGDKEQLVPLLKAGLMHDGFALIDVISPCVTFNNHKGSTKSYDQTRVNQVEMIHSDFIDQKDEIVVDYAKGSKLDVELHDGSHLLLHKTAENYDPMDRAVVFKYLHDMRAEGQVPTGLLFLDPKSQDMHEQNKTISQSLNEVPFADLCPGKEALDQLQQKFI